MGSNRATLSRSVYVDRLRRAFILRCHPDQFRQHSDVIRKQQSVLLQALGDRMVEEDFKDYTSNKTRKRYHDSIGDNHYHQHSRRKQPIVKYSLEKRDGSLLYRTLDLNASVENILQDLAAALESSGATTIPPPPQQLEKSDSGSMEWIKYYMNKNPKGTTVDHRYNVNSNRGRDLQRFLSSITPTQIEERKACRMDAIAKALVARRLFRFQSIDGVRLGWSSKAFAGLMSSLIGLHEEYEPTFGVRSFYPLRLVFTHDVDDKKHSLDVYGGNLYLNPSATQLEWLKSIKEVTEERLETFSMNRHSVLERVSFLQEGLGANNTRNNGIKVQKGFTCSSLEYYLFLERNSKPYRGKESLSSEIQRLDCNELVPIHSPSLCATSPFKLVVESPQSCRRARVTKEGFIQVPSTITSSELILAVTKLSSLAGKRHDAEQQEKEICRKASEEVQWELGLRRVSRHDERVSHKDFSSALLRLLDHKQHLVEGCLSGASLRVASSGQFCHLSDGGSLVIPHNWTYMAT